MKSAEEQLALIARGVEQIVPHEELKQKLQQRTGAVYTGLAAAGWGGRWLVVDADVNAGQLAARLTA